MRMIRREPRASNGFNNGDLDVAFQLFACGMVWDGALSSKESRDHFVANGYAVRRSGVQAMTGRGVLHFLSTPAVWRSAFNRWRSWRHNPLVANAAQVERSLR